MRMINLTTLLKKAGLHVWLIPACFLWAVIPVSGADVIEPAGETPATDEAEIVDLPPLLVEDVKRPIRWNYVAFSGVEILSACHSDTTQRFARAYQIQREALRLVIPEEFQMQAAVPEIIVLFDQSTGRAMPAELVETANAIPLPGKNETIRKPSRRLGDLGTLNLRLMPNLMVSTLDGFASCVDISRIDAMFGTARWENALRLSDERLRLLLQRRTPALPNWYTEGALELMKRVQIENRVLELEPLDWPLKDLQGRAIVGGKAGQQDVRKRPVEPLLDVFLPVGNDVTEVAQMKRATQALFIRWALDTKEKTRREGLWALVRRSSSEPVTDELLKECVGMDSKQLWKQLDLYLKQAVKRSARLTPAERVNRPEVKPREATPVEVARIMGDWQRFEAEYLAPHPRFQKRYLEAAQKAAGKIENPERDPQLVVVRGLIETAAGNHAVGRTFLELAFRSDAIDAFRPSAGLGLTKLRLMEIHPEGANGLLAEAQARFVLAPLERVKNLPPVMADGFCLWSEVWTRCEILPSDALDTVREGVRLFPGDEQVILRAAELHCSHGLHEMAMMLGTHGLRVAHDPIIRERLAAIVRSGGVSLLTK